MGQNQMLQHKGYLGSIEISNDCFCGTVQDIRSIISYKGKTAEELVANFRSAIDEYLLSCDEQGISPERPYTGKFTVQVSPELHKRAVVFAKKHKTDLNQVVECALQNTLATEV